MLLPEAEEVTLTHLLARAKSAGSHAVYLMQMLSGDCLLLINIALYLPGAVLAAGTQNCNQAVLSC